MSSVLVLLVVSFSWSDVSLFSVTTDEEVEDVAVGSDFVSFSIFCVFAISLASATHSSRFESSAKHSSSHCRELEAKSHKSTTASKFSPSLGIKKTVVEVVVLTSTVVEGTDVVVVVTGGEGF